MDASQLVGKSNNVIETLTHLSKGNEGGVDGKGQFDRKLWGYNGSQDEGTLQE